MLNFQKELENISIINAVQFKLFLAVPLIDREKTRTTILQIFLAVFHHTHWFRACLKNPMGGGAWWAAVHGVAKSRTQLSDFTFTFRFRALEEEMVAHSSVLAWRIPGTGEPGGLPSLGSHRVGHG